MLAISKHLTWRFRRVFHILIPFLSTQLQLYDRICYLSVILRRIQFSISSIVFLRWQPVPLSRLLSSQIVRIQPETHSSYISATTYLARDPKTRCRFCIFLLTTPVFGISGNISQTKPCRGVDIARQRDAINVQHVPVSHGAGPGRPELFITLYCNNRKNFYIRRRSRYRF